MEDSNSKMTEDDTVLLLIEYLKKNGYLIKSHCLGHQRGYDIVAEIDNKEFIIEVKGAKANKNSPIKKRAFFDSGQIKDHLGKAIVKSIETQIQLPKAKVGIAHPNDSYIKKTIGSVTPKLKTMNIIHMWVHSNGIVEFD